MTRILFTNVLATNLPVVDLNFGTGSYFGGDGTLASLLPVSNSTGGYVANAGGTLTLVAANTPRIGIGTGLLVEEARTNLLLQSKFAASWGSNSVVLTPNVAAAPDGTTTAATMIENSATNLHGIDQFTGITTGAITTYTETVYAKANGRRLFISIGNGGAGGANGAFVIFDLAVGQIGVAAATFGAGFSAVSASITASANGFYRLTLTTTVAAGLAIWSSFYLDNGTGTAAQSTNYLGDGSSGVYLWGAQLEQASFPTSYIPTTTVAATRAADVPSLIGAAASVLGTFTFSALVNGSGSAAPPASGSNTYALLTLDTVGDDMVVYFNEPGSTTVHSSAPAGGIATTLGSGTWGGFTRNAVGADGSGKSLVSNVGTVASDAHPFTSVNALQLGCGTGLFQYNGYITRFALWNKRLTDTQLQALSQ